MLLVKFQNHLNQYVMSCDVCVAVTRLRRVLLTRRVVCGALTLASATTCSAATPLKWWVLRTYGCSSQALRVLVWRLLVQTIILTVDPALTSDVQSGCLSLGSHFTVAALTAAVHTCYTCGSWDDTGEAVWPGRCLCHCISTMDLSVAMWTYSGRTMP